MTTAEQIVERLKRYEEDHAGDTTSFNPWSDIIDASGMLDEEATEAAAAAYASPVAVFRDGSIAVSLPREGRWRAMGPLPRP